MLIAPFSDPPESNSQEQDWLQYTRELQNAPLPTFDEVLATYRTIYGNRQPEAPPAIVWQPTPESASKTNLAHFMAETGHADYQRLHRWSITNRSDFWASVISKLGIRFQKPPARGLDIDDDPEQVHWLPGAELNIVDSCFKASADHPAIVSGCENAEALSTTTYGELKELVDRVAAGLQELGFRPDDALALYMPMTPECVAAYLGIIKSGCRVVSIADSFSPTELRKRLALGNTSGIITVDRMRRGDRVIDLYSKVKEAGAPRAMVIPATEALPDLRSGDILWDDLLSATGTTPSSVGGPERITNILFSSGTTGTPKAIPWTQLTPIKAAMDGYFHQDIHPEDVVAWPTNIGWMMGPWLIYATLVNGATMALFEGIPTGLDFIRFIRSADVTILGLVPALARAWRSADPDLDLTGIRLFSSTGETSNLEDYLWLMSRTRFQAPVIEYCGGTEIGGGYITGTMVQSAAPSVFTTPAMGVDFVILGEEQQPVDVGEMGELYIKPPSIGLSQTLLNGDHHQTYFAGCPKDADGSVLRRHGDQVRALPGGYYCAEGRVDDTMNLGGIKVSSIELENVLNKHPNIYESAAVSVPSQGGGERLIVFAVTGSGTQSKELKQQLNREIAIHLNPLFKIHDVVIVKELPRTASNKLMRRSLRERFLEGRP